MSEKKLFQVDLEVSFEMVVEAESAEEAQRWAEEHYKDGLEDVSYPGVFGSVMGNKPLDKCPSDWNGCLPYNADDDKKTIDQFFDSETPVTSAHPGPTLREEEIIKRLRERNKTTPETPE